MKPFYMLASGVLLGTLLGYLVWGRPQPEPAPSPVTIEPPPVVNHPPRLVQATLKARVVSWDVGYYPATEAEWLARVVQEVQAANAAKVDVLLFPELFASGLGPYAPDDSNPVPYITQRMHAAVLPAVHAVADPKMLLVLGTYPHQESGSKHAYNRCPVLLDRTWYFLDKLHPTQSEAHEEPPIRAGESLPTFAFRGGTVAVGICFSLEMPEVASAFKVADVQLVLGPSATADDHGSERIHRTASARAVELGAAVLVAPLVGEQETWKNLGHAALYLPAQQGFPLEPARSQRRTHGIAHDDFVIPWQALMDLRQQPTKPETRPFLVPVRPWRTTNGGPR